MATGTKGAAWTMLVVAAAVETVAICEVGGSEEAGALGAMVVTDVVAAGGGGNRARWV